MACNLKCDDQGTFTPVGAQGGGGPRDPTKKPTFPAQICDEICTIMYAL